MLRAPAKGGGEAIMSLHLFDHLTYSEEDWRIMEKARIRACELLGQRAGDYENNERLARTIMKVFDAGTRDYEILASIAAHRETVMVRRPSTHH
jgi:hypothetical protein